MALYPQSSQIYFRSLKIIHAAMTGMQLFVALLLVFLIELGLQEPVGDEVMRIPLLVAGAVLCAGGYLGGSVLFSARVKLLKANNELIKKMLLYRSVLIIRYSLVEMPSLFSVVGYMLTGELLFLLLTLVMSAYLFTLRPSRIHAIRDLSLSKAEIGLINDPTAVISTVSKED